MIRRPSNKPKKLVLTPNRLRRKYISKQESSRSFKIELVVKAPLQGAQTPTACNHTQQFAPSADNSYEFGQCSLEELIMISAIDSRISSPVSIQLPDQFNDIQGSSSPSKKA